MTETNISKIFKMYSGAERGSCYRNAPNGSPMQQRILDDLNDAFEMVDVVLDQIPRATSPDGEKIRWLFKLFFGVSFNSDNLKANASDGSLETYKRIYTNFRLVSQLNGVGRRDVSVPWLRCLEDYSFFSRHTLGADQKEDLGPDAPLAAEYYGTRMPNGQFYPGLLFVINPAPYESMDFYYPSSSNPWSGSCDADKFLYAFTIPSNNRPALRGITLCPFYFEALKFRNLGEPQPSHLQAVNMANIRTYGRMSAATLLHELTHLGTENWIGDVNAVKPPDGSPKPELKSWVTDPKRRCYGYVNTARLGLARPWEGQRNADSYLFFALCLRFTALDCVGRYQNRIKHPSATARSLARVGA